MADCRLVPVLLHHTLAASTADGRAPPCLSPAALIAVTARCCECVRPPQEPTATTGTSVVTETGGVTVLPDWGGTKVLPDYMDVRGIVDVFAKEVIAVVELVVEDFVGDDGVDVNQIVNSG